MSILELIDNALDADGDAMRWTPPDSVEPSTSDLYFALSGSERKEICRWLRDQGVEPGNVPVHPSMFGFDETYNEWVIEHYSSPKRVDPATGKPRRYVRRVGFRSPPPPAVVKFVLQLREVTPIAD